MSDPGGTTEQGFLADPDFVEGIIETSPVGIAVVNADGEVTFANERAEEIYGRSCEEIDEFSHDDSRLDLVDENGEPFERGDAPFDRVVANQEAIYDQVLGLRRPSGERVWVSVNGAPQWNDEGELERAVFAFKNVTEQRELEAELDEILGRVTDAFYALDEEFRFTHVNDQAEKLLQASEEELIGEKLWELYPESAGIDEVWDAFHTAMETQEAQSYELYYDPLGFWVEATVYPSETGVSVYFQDITDRVNRTQRLQARERAVRDAYEIIADPDKPFRAKVEDLLRVVRSTIGTDYATLSLVNEGANEYIFETIDAPDDVDLDAGDSMPLDETICVEAVRTERTVVLENVEADAPELADRDSSAEWGISCYLGTPVTVGDDVYGTFCFYDTEERIEGFSDWEKTFVELLGQWVSHELERERDREKLEKSNERLEQFAYTASHDLQEPLRMVSSYLQLLDRRYGDDLNEDGREFLEFAVDGAERMREMIEGLLAYSRVETRGEPLEPTDLDDVFEDVLETLQLQIHKHDAEIDAESLPTVTGDASQLRQLFQNLLDNAITYSGDEPPQIEVSAERHGEDVLVSVEDEGIGIDPDDQEDVFEVFNRLHTQDEHAGTGIGLALCERIVERHGGEIWVESEPGEGTTFSFTLPASDP